MSKPVTDRELLIRIDERQREMIKRLSEVCKVLDHKVDYDNDYKEMEEKVNKMWDKWNLAIGYMVGAGVVGGVASKLLSGLASTVMAAFR